MFLVNKLYNATKWSLAGLYSAYKNEVAFKIELFCAVILIPCTLYIAESLSELILLILPLFLVLIVELLNTAIEAVVDRVGLEQNQLSRIAKDAGSAAVFVSILLVVVVWGMVIINHF